MSMPLPGKVQTNELYAVIRVVKRDKRALKIRTDSAYVINGAGSIQKACKGDNADLWGRLARAMEIHHHPVVFTKVSGRTKIEDVLAGRVAGEDKEGNDGADALAVSAAESQEVPAELVRGARSEPESKEGGSNAQDDA